MPKTSLPSRFVEGFARWRVKRATNRALSQLTARDLKDIGLIWVGNDYLSTNPHHKT